MTTFHIVSLTLLLMATVLATMSCLALYTVLRSVRSLNGLLDLLLLGIASTSRSLWSFTVHLDPVKGLSSKSSRGYFRGTSRTSMRKLLGTVTISSQQKHSRRTP